MWTNSLHWSCVQDCRSNSEREGERKITVDTKIKSPLYARNYNTVSTAPVRDRRNCKVPAPVEEVGARAVILARKRLL